LSTCIELWGYGGEHGQESEESEESEEGSKKEKEVNRLTVINADLLAFLKA
jgi:hypothetical protein